MKERPVHRYCLISLFLALGVLLSIFPQMRYPWAWPYETISGNSFIHAIYWFSVAVIYLVMFLSLVIRQKLSVPIRYAILFVVMLCYLIAIAFFHESQIQSQANRTLQTLTLSFGEQALMLGEGIYDLLLAFSFLFLWPYAKLQPRYQNLLPFFVVLLGLASSIFGFVLSPESGHSYPYCHSFFVNDVEYGKVMFAAMFGSVLLAQRRHGWQQWLFSALGAYFLVSMAFQALAMAFWASAIAAGFICLSLVNDENKERSLMAKIASPVYLASLIALALLLAIPSPASAFLRPYLTSSLVDNVTSCFLSWAHYLNALSSFRVMIGDGLMGYYRYAFIATGEKSRVMIDNGFLESYNAGGVIMLLFYVLLILVGFNALKKEEGHDAVLFAVIASFSMAFLFYSVFTNERLLFSSHFLSYVVSYFFSCYTSEKITRNPLNMA